RRRGPRDRWRFPGRGGRLRLARVRTSIRPSGSRRDWTSSAGSGCQETMEWDPRGHLGHVVPGVSKILRIRATAQEDRFHNSGELGVYREAQTDIPDPLFIPDKSAWPRLPSRLPWPRLQPMVRMDRPDSGAGLHRTPTGPAP